MLLMMNSSSTSLKLNLLYDIRFNIGLWNFFSELFTDFCIEFFFLIYFDFLEMGRGDLTSHLN